MVLDFLLRSDREANIRAMTEARMLTAQSFFFSKAFFLCQYEAKVEQPSPEEGFVTY